MASSPPSNTNGMLAHGGNTIIEECVITVVKAETGYKVLSLKEFELHTTSSPSLPKEFLDRWAFKGLPAYLRREVYILVSVRSGTGLAEKFLEVLLPVLDAVGVKGNIILTKSAESVKEFVKETLLPAANDGKKQTVLMLSGDGGVVDSINSLGGRTKYVLLHFVALLTIAGNMRNQSLSCFHLELEMRFFILFTNFHRLHRFMFKD